MRVADLRIGRECRVPGSHATGELGMRRRDTAVEDIYRHATTASASHVRRVEGKLALVDSVERDGGRAAQREQGVAVCSGREVEDAVGLRDGRCWSFACGGSGQMSAARQKSRCCGSAT